MLQYTNRPIYQFIYLLGVYFRNQTWQLSAGGQITGKHRGEKLNSTPDVTKPAKKTHNHHRSQIYFETAWIVYVRKDSEIHYWDNAWPDTQGYEHITEKRKANAQT